MADREGLSEVEQLTAELLDRYEEINLLYDIGEALAGVFDVGAIGRTVVDRAVTVIRAEGGLFLRLEPETHEVTYRKGGLPEGLLEALAPGGELLRRALAAPVLVVNPEGGAAPLLVVRVQQGEQVFGLLALAGKTDGGSFTAGDGRLLQALGTQAATAIHTEHLVRELKESERFRSQLEVARQLQRSLLPAANPVIPGLEIVATCQPAGHVGGDYFDFFPRQDGRLGLVIADVSGHGVGSALVMAGLRAMLHFEMRSGLPPARVLESANALLLKDLAASDMFVSVVLALYNPPTGTLLYANGGHPPPLLLRPGREGVERLEVGGPIVGLFPNPAYEQEICYLEPGAILLFYTDGVTEARGPDGEMFGEEALVQVLRESRTRTSAELHAEVLARVSRHLAGGEIRDDVTLIAAWRKP